MTLGAPGFFWADYFGLFWEPGSTILVYFGNPTILVYFGNRALAASNWGTEVRCSMTAGTFAFGDPMTPMVMAGTGTGVAPFLAFAQERDWLMEKEGAEGNNGQMWLFYGCRNKSKDYIMGDLLEQLEAKNVLTHLRPAFSRDQAEKVYIQDRIRQEAKGIYDALVTNKGYAYLCGQAGDREQDVVDAWTDAIRIGGTVAYCRIPIVYHRILPFLTIACHCIRSYTIAGHRKKKPSCTIPYHRLPSRTIVYPLSTIAHHRTSSHTIIYHRIPSLALGYRCMSNASLAHVCLMPA